MDFDLALHNRPVTRLVVGEPAGGRGIRARLETALGDVVTIEEGTLAALVRAYMSVSTQPQVDAVELRVTPDGAGGHTFVEVSADQETLRTALSAAGDALGPDLSQELEPQADEDDDLALDDLELDDGVVFGGERTQQSGPLAEGDENS